MQSNPNSRIPWPEDFTALEGLLLAELGGDSRIFLHRLISEGKSGAHVMVADVTSEKFTGLAILKLDRAQSARRAEALEHERHRRAIEVAPDYAAHYLPKLVCAVTEADKVAALTTIAGRGLEYALPWSACSYGPQLETAVRLSDDLLERWNANYSLEPDMLLPQDLLSQWLDYRIHRESGSRIHDFIESKCSLNASAPTLLFDGDWLPNPLAFAVGLVSLPDTAHLRAIRGNQHGDLHGKNVLVTKQAEIDPNYYLIDLDFYRDDGFLFYDHAMFELDYLLTSREAIRPRHWKTIMQNLRRGSQGPRDAGLVGEDIGILQLVREFRDKPRHWIDRHEPNRLSFLESQYMLARIAAGLAVSHQRRDDVSRALGFLYAAFNLKDYLALHEFDWPRHGPEFAIQNLYEGSYSSVVGAGTEAIGKPQSAAAPGQPLNRPPKRVVAVLPLLCSNDQQALEQIADGVTDGIISDLSRIDWFTTVARSAMRSYRSGDIDPRTAGRELDAHYVACGSVRKVEDNIQVSIRLIETESGNEVWSEKYRFDSGVDDLLTNEDIIANTIAASIDTEVDRNEQDNAMRASSEDPDCWGLVMRARWHMSQMTREDNEAARELALRAVEKMPGYAAPHALLTQIKIRSFFFGWNEWSEGEMEDAVNLARRAVSLDPGSSYAHESLARAYLFARRIAPAVREAETAVSLNPSSSSAHLWLAIAMLWAGKPAEVLPIIELSLKLGKYNQGLVFKLTVKAAAYFALGRLQKAEELMQQAVEVGSGEMIGHLFLAIILSQQGRLEEARQSVRMALEKRPDMNCRKLGVMFSGMKPEFMEPLLERVAALGIPE
ncbi:tetratricopeptide repeat protein [Hoeflea poritis]|uniref:Tetratricopeptide repeat protein n=1 Tax=Hoeflea poritis TaxID=2993659 RepID=A0ABT4VUJ7_9HYPH|nr:tetratricopeptide repeat protein [Hoeflea poritis]MDA4848388.1 tetratricopeptide repeat protein [Hoeflea poritis]